MRNAASRMESVLEGLGHHDTLDLLETHSRTTGGKDTYQTTLSEILQGLGKYRLWTFRALHHEELSSALARFGGVRETAEALAWRGRLRRILGDLSGAREDLENSLKRHENSRAAGWLGELLLTSESRRAESALSRAAELDPRWPWPRLWLGLARMQASQRKAAFRELDAFTALGGSDAVVARLLRYYLHTIAGDHARALSSARAVIAADPSCAAGHATAGQAWHALGQSRQALRYFHAARDLDLDAQGPALYRDFGINLEWHRPQAHLRALDGAIRRHPGQAILYAERAELKRDPSLCLYESALKDYEEAARLEPGIAWIAAVLARAKNNHFGGEAGLEEFDRAAALNPRSGWIYSWRGAARARLWRSLKALADFSRAVELMPNYSFTYAWRGALYNRLGRYRRASADLDTAIRLDPHYIFSYNERFQCRRGLKQYESAVEDLNIAHRADPKYTWLGQARLGGKVAAIKELDGAVKAWPRSAWLHAWRGYCLLRAGRAREAEAGLNRALTLAPETASLLAWRGWARKELGRHDSAEADLKRAVALEPSDRNAWEHLGDLYESRGDKAAARGMIARAAELAPTTVSLWVRKARLEAALGRPRKALEDLHRAGQLHPGDAGVLLMSAELRLGMGKLAEALADIERLLSSERPPGRAFLLRGMIRQKRGDSAGQIADFRRALEIDPGLFPAEQRREVEKLVGADV